MLAKRIQRELEKKTARNGHCAIYEDQLQRMWPLKQGLCAMFEKEAQRTRRT
jgi:hypothetical protein